MEWFYAILSIMVMKFVEVFLGLFLTVITDSFQCWCWTDRLLYCDWYHVGYGRKRRGCGYLQLCQSFAVPAHQHGTNWGTAVCLWSTWCFLKRSRSGFHCDTAKWADGGPVEGVSTGDNCWVQKYPEPGWCNKSANSCSLHRNKCPPNYVTKGKKEGFFQGRPYFRHIWDISPQLWY